MMQIVWGILGGMALVMNVIAYVLMGVDKRRAKRNKWRIRERTLFLVTALMGGLGGTLGMLHYRHKTKHWYFRVGFPLLLVLQIALVVWLIVRFGGA